MINAMRISLYSSKTDFGSNIFRKEYVKDIDW